MEPADSIIQLSSGPAYELSLSDGDKWFFAGVGLARPFVERFSRVMGLTANSNPDGNLMFFYPANDEETTEVPSSLGSWHKIHYSETKAITIWKSENCPHLHLSLVAVTTLKQGLIPSCIRTIIDAIYCQAIDNGGLPIHGGLLEKGGEGIIIAAPGETGKTTCCRRISNPWSALCDDQTLITCNSFAEFRAHPFPNWNDIIIRRQSNVWNGNYSVNLRGIFFLEQSRADKITPLGRGEATIRLSELSIQALDIFYFNNPPSSQLNQLRSAIFNSAVFMTKEIPCFVLEASMEGAFWEQIEQALDL